MRKDVKIHLGQYRKITEKQAKTDEAILKSLLHGTASLPELARRTKAGTTDERAEALDRLESWGMVETWSTRLGGKTVKLTATGQAFALDMTADAQVATYDLQEKQRLAREAARRDAE